MPSLQSLIYTYLFTNFSCVFMDFLYSKYVPSFFFRFFTFYFIFPFLDYVHKCKKGVSHTFVH